MGNEKNPLIAMPSLQKQLIKSGASESVSACQCDTEAQRAVTLLHQTVKKRNPQTQLTKPALQTLEYHPRQLGLSPLLYLQVPFAELLIAPLPRA